MAEDIKKISEFNESAYQINRLNNIWIKCQIFRNSGLLINWKWKLDDALAELSYDASRLDDSEDKEYLKTLQRIDKEIAFAEKYKNLRLLYKKLFEKELILREIQQECGKGSRYKSADEDVMD